MSIPPNHTGSRASQGSRALRKGFFPKLLSISSGDFGDIIRDIMGYLVNQFMCHGNSLGYVHMGYVHPPWDSPWESHGEKELHIYHRS